MISTRLLDITFSIIGLILLLPLMLIVSALAWFDTRSPLFIQERVGRQQRPFKLVKFRTMRPGTSSVATHLASPSAVTPFGHFLRRTKLDELPQLWNVLKGEMSLVGPRPCLFSQRELINERESRGVFVISPGITGLAQTRGIDMSTPALLAETDARMLATLNLGNYLRYIFLTIVGKGTGDRIIHHDSHQSIEGGYGNGKKITGKKQNAEFRRL